MEQNDKIQLFENRHIRTAWDEEQEEWYFSVVDAVGVLTDQPDQRHASTYWAVLKKRLAEESGNELLTNCKQLKMIAADGKRRATDVANTEQLLRIIQSIPSPKAEPFKLWLAQVGRGRIEEAMDPEGTVGRALETYLKNGVKIHHWPHAQVWLIARGSRFDRERILQERFLGQIVYTGTVVDSLLETIAQGKRTALWRQRYTSPDLVAFTEADFLEGKKATTEELRVVLWERFQLGKISVLTAEGFPDFLVKTFGDPEE